MPTLTSGIENLKHAWLLINDHLFAVRILDGRIVCLFDEERERDRERDVSWFEILSGLKVKQHLPLLVPSKSKTRMEVV
jgi:hypothetical protein